MTVRKHFAAKLRLYPECHIYVHVYCNGECRYAECHYADCHYDECHYSDCHGAVLLCHK